MRRDSVRRTSLGSLALAVIALAAGCGPSASEIRRAKASIYRTQFANVWNAVVTSVREEYPRLKRENPIHGDVLTDFHLIERVPIDDTTTTGPAPVSRVAGEAPQQIQGGKFIRMSVHITGGPRGPWVVEVDGEAAEYKPGMTLIVPIPHGAADEPPWVQVRIDRLYVKIHKKLSKYAEVRNGPSTHDVKRRTVDATPWGNLPAEAARIVAEAHDGAVARDVSVLRPLLADEFVWSAGAAPGADQALAMWSADPTILKELAHVLEAGCAVAAGDADAITCPTPAGQPGGYVAEFRRIEAKKWRFVSFYRGE